jgi:hypothetical protein
LFDSVLETRFKDGEEELLLNWFPTWVKASEVEDLANVPWQCHRPAHYAPSAEQGNDSPPLQYGEPPAKRGRGRPRTMPVPLSSPDLVTSEMLNAKRGPGRPPKWLTEARRAAKRGAGQSVVPKVVPQPPELLHAKRGPGRPPKWLTEARRVDEAARVLAGLTA